MRVAILPAAGKAERMGGTLPKQLLQLSSGQRVIDYALSAAALADCWLHIIVPSGDEEIARYVKRGSFSYAVDDGNKPLADIAALRSVYEGAEILYVMPDTLFRPLDIGVKLLERLTPQTDVTLACFETDTPERFGMCGVWDGRICEIRDKPKQWDGEYFGNLAWGLVAWEGPAFWGAIEYAVESRTLSEALRFYLPQVSTITHYKLGHYQDIGTPEDYERALEEGW